MSRECRDFWQLPSSEREVKFRQYPLEKQVDLYLCGLNREPPEIGYAAYIAERGEPVIPYLVNRIKAEPLEITKTRLLGIFVFLSAKGNLRGRNDVIDELEHIIINMGDGPVKTKAQGYMDMIKKQNTRATESSLDHR